jgi:PAS domain S-box-containing protein
LKNELLNDLRAQLSDQESIIKDKTNLLEQLKQSNDLLKIEIKEARNEMEKIRAENIDIETKNRELRNNLIVGEEIGNKLEKTKIELQNKIEELNNKNSIINKNLDNMKYFEEEISRLKLEIEKKDNNLKESSVKIQNMENTLVQLKNKMLDKDRIIKQKAEIENGMIHKIKNLNEIMQQKDNNINSLNVEKNILKRYFESIKDSIPSTVIMTDKNNNITNINKKAKQTLGLDPEKIIGENITKLDLMKRQRIKEAMESSINSKNVIDVKSISIKDTHGERILTNITNIPFFNSKGEYQGLTIILEDVTDLTTMKAEMKRRDMLVNQLDNKLYGNCSRLKLDSQIDVKKEDKSSLKPTADTIQDISGNIENMNQGAVKLDQGVAQIDAIEKLQHADGGEINKNSEEKRKMKSEDND